MTLDIPTRPQEQQAPVDDRRNRRGLKGGPQITFGRTPRAAKGAALVVGGQPRANLLPPEIILKRRQLKTRRALRVGVFFVFIATVAACAGVFALSSVSQVALTLAQDRQAQLVEQQLQYQEVRDVQSTITTIHAGQEVGASTEINLNDFLARLQKSLPKGVVLKTVAIDSATPMVPFPQSELPLQGARVGSITFTATSKTLPSIPDWLRALEKLPGYVDATPGSVDLTGGTYTAQVLMHFNEQAFSQRFDPDHMAEVAAQQAHSSGEVKSMTSKADDAVDANTDDEGQD